MAAKSKTKATEARLAFLAYHRNYYRANKARELASRAAYYEANRPGILAFKKAYRLENLEKERARQNAFYYATREQVLADRKAYYEANRERIAAKRNAGRGSQRRKDVRNRYHAARIGTDRNYRLARLLRQRLYNALRRAGASKDASALELVGCTVQELVAHLESQFAPGMSWKNRTAWHVDHRRRCADFDLEDPEQQLACFHFSNLQPLWAADNLRKH